MNTHFVSTASLALLLSLPMAGLANPPVEIEFQDIFDDVNPCTGLLHTLTVSGTLRVQAHDGQSVGVLARTITTVPTAFVGHGTQTIVENASIFHVRLLDVLTNARGERIRARFVLVVDVNSGSVRVQKGEVICLPTGTT